MIRLYQMVDFQQIKKDPHNDLMRHPNVKLTPDGGAAPYRMPDDYAQTAQTISPDVVTELTEPAITDVMYDEIQKIMEEIHNEQERNL